MPYLKARSVDEGEVGGAEPPQIDVRGAVRRPEHLVYIYIYIFTLIHKYMYIHTSVDLSLYSDIVSGHVARRSVLKLTVSMFCLCIFSCIFSIDGRS